MSRPIQHEKNNRYARSARSELIEYAQKVRSNAGGCCQSLESTVPFEKIIELKARQQLMEQEKTKLLRRLQEFLVNSQKTD